MGVAKIAAACIRCGRTKVNGRCPVCPLPKGERRPYSSTAEYRRVLREALDTYGVACAYRCGAPILGVEPDDDGGWTVRRDVADPLVLAHVVAHEDGGEFTVENVRPAHRSCNAAAGKTPLEEA